MVTVPGLVLTCAPGNPNSVMSPAGATSLEDQQYMEKLKQLSKYIEPLRRMINKIDKNEGAQLPLLPESHDVLTTDTDGFSLNRPEEGPE